MQWTWPDGKSFAFFLSFDFEANTPAILDDERDYVTFTKGRNGLLAIPRLLDIMHACGTKTTFFITTWLIENHPDLLNDIVKQGHEIGCHGYLHEHLTRISAEEERVIFEKSDALCKEFFGGPTAGFRAPHWKMNKGTLDLISEFGFRYDSSMMDSNEPYILIDGKNPVVELPVSVFLDDYPHYEIGRRSAAEFKKLVLEEVDAVKEQGRYMALSMHPWVEMLVQTRLNALKDIIEYVQEHDGYIATGSELAATALKNLG